MSVMIEAARTTASPASIWALVVVAVGGLVFWLSAVALASRNTAARHRRVPDVPDMPAAPIPAPRAADADQPQHQ